MSTVRTRFAPSPSGHLHVGGARTALFCWAYAHGHDGKFVLRIEDTDRQRHNEEASAAFQEDLHWLGIDWDEGPLHQSDRLDLYNAAVEKLIETGAAYRAFETPEELAAAREAAGHDYRYDRAALKLDEAMIRQHLDEGRPHVVRFKTPDDGEITFEDAVRGTVTVQAAELDDFVIRKADGWPIYHLAVVVDDEDMGVTHVIRAQEHLYNTPRHVLLQDALGYSRPVYAHVSLIFNPDGSKMSKRDKEKKGLEVDVEDFRRSGYLPEVMVNYLALLGWSPGGDVEKFDAAFLVEHFDFDRVIKSEAKFDRDKLLAFNLDALQGLDPDAFEQRLLAHGQRYHPDFLKSLGPEKFPMFAACNQARSKTLDDPYTSCGFFIADDAAIEYEDTKPVRKALRNGEPNGLEHLEAVRPLLADLDEWNAASLETAMTAYAETHADGKLGKIAQPLRIAVTGGVVSPAIFETLEILGRDATVARIDRCLKQQVTT